MSKPLSEMIPEELWKLFPIILKEYNPLYSDWYLVEEKSLKELLLQQIERMSHIGNSAVKGCLM